VSGCSSGTPVAPAARFAGSGEADSISVVTFAGDIADHYASFRRGFGSDAPAFLANRIQADLVEDVRVSVLGRCGLVRPGVVTRFPMRAVAVVINACLPGRKP
jgi:hypothetical protein